MDAVIIKKKHGDERRGPSEEQVLSNVCSEDINSLCGDAGDIRQTKSCLASNFDILTAPCAEYLISPSSTQGGGDMHFGFGRHHGRFLIPVAIFFGLLVLVCCVRKRCKARHRWHLNNRVQDTRYIAVPTQVMPNTPSSQIQTAQVYQAPTAPQAQQPQHQQPMSQNVVYAASPYIGGVPMNAVPVAYNPQAMTHA